MRSRVISVCDEHLDEAFAGWEVRLPYFVYFQNVHKRLGTRLANLVALQIQCRQRL
jgi:hypothetical protein